MDCRLIYRSQASRFCWGLRPWSSLDWILPMFDLVDVALGILPVQSPHKCKEFKYSSYILQCALVEGPVANYRDVAACLAYCGSYNKTSWTV
jgi:hypothetical protein